MLRIIGVHGVNQFHSGWEPDTRSAQLGEMWSAALTRSMADVPFELTVPYFAHLLRGSASQSGDSDPDSLDEEALEMLVAWDLELNGPVGVDQGDLTRIPRDVVGRMSGMPWGELPIQLFILTFLRDVQRYLGKRNGERRIAARDHVADKIRSTGAHVVVGHSLGSVVAYEALSAHPDIEVDVLVTIGSPLGLPKAVFNRLSPKPVTRPAPRPPGVRKWVNISDVGDLCAIPKGFATSFAVDREHETEIHAFRYHSVLDYLAHEMTGKAVRGD
ncbi:hypothetical protein [Amycolatopsis sp. RTGN1]|uniref:hypothetical protein n=1 Tax=Amycolatopsis ponsaeliensis TaxID=2992142 RepID=UPI00254EB52E|nr:hypothetical protein [Amycolatopsis sp. RTGN1]